MNILFIKESWFFFITIYEAAQPIYSILNKCFQTFLFTKESWKKNPQNHFYNCFQYWYTLKNKGASRCHGRTFLSKWFHKEPLTSEETVSQKVFVVKEGSSDYKKVRKRCSLTEWFFVEAEMVLLCIDVKNLLSTFIFKRVVIINVFCSKTSY